MNSLIYSFLFLLNVANAGEEYEVICVDQMRFSYTGKTSNYTPNELCESHGGLYLAIGNTYSSDDNLKSKKEIVLNKKNSLYKTSIWLTPYALKPIYNVSIDSYYDDYIHITGKDYKNFYSAGLIIEKKYIYTDMSLLSFAGNVAFEEDLFNNFHTKDSLVFGFANSFGLSLPLFYQRNKKLSLFAGIYYERTVGQTFNNDALCTSFGVRSSIKKLFMEALSTDTYNSFDYMPTEAYSGYNPSINFKIGLSLN